MALSKDQIRLLTQVVAETQEHELDCEEFLNHLAAWSERVNEGESIETASQFVQHHLAICPECSEEFRLLTEVLKDRL